MSDEMGFIRAVIDSPDDDAVRLVYSDWLEEQGRNPDMIRLQVKEKRQRYEFPAGVDCRIWSSSDLLAGQSPPRMPPDRLFVFQEYINCYAKWWLENADWLLEYHPIRVASLNFSYITGQIIFVFAEGSRFCLMCDRNQVDPISVYGSDIPVNRQTNSDGTIRLYDDHSRLMLVAKALLGKRWSGVNFQLKYDRDVPCVDTMDIA